MKQVFQALAAHAAIRPDVIAFQDDTDAVTWAGLAIRVADLAQRLTDAPQTIGIALAGGIDYVVADLAITLSGRRQVPLPFFFSNEQNAHILMDAQIGAVVANDPSLFAALPHLQVIDPALSDATPRALPDYPSGADRVIYTSGSSGQPKGVIIGDRQLDASLRALAQEAARLGYDLILAGRTESKLAETAALIPDTSVTVVASDVTTAAGRQAIQAAVGGGLDILINNAGTLAVGHLANLDDDALARMVSTNLTAPIALTRDLLPAQTAKQGRIVNIGSVFGDIAYPFFVGYSATKFGLRGFSDAIRRELSGTGISVTYIAPRATRTAAESEFAALVEPMQMTLDSVERVATQDLGCHPVRQA